MKLLLDTHIFLWALLEPECLPPGYADMLSSEENEIWLSPISVWECLVLASKGRLLLKPDPERWIRKALRDFPPHEAPITNEVAIRSRGFDLPHDDPADRFLAATAAVFGLTLVTADERLKGGKGYHVLAVP